MAFYWTKNSDGSIDVETSVPALATLMGMAPQAGLNSAGETVYFYSLGRCATAARSGGVADDNGNYHAFEICENSGGYSDTNFKKGYLLTGASPYHNIYSNNSPSEWYLDSTNIGASAAPAVSWLSATAVRCRLKRYPFDVSQEARSYPSGSGTVSLTPNSDNQSGHYGFDSRDWEGYDHSATALSASITVLERTAEFILNSITRGSYDWEGVDLRFGSSDYELVYLVKLGNTNSYSVVREDESITITSGSYTLCYAMALASVSDLNNGTITPLIQFPHTLVEMSVNVYNQTPNSIMISWVGTTVSSTTTSDTVTSTKVAFNITWTSTTSTSLHTSTVTYVTVNGDEITEVGSTILPQTLSSVSWSHTFTQQAHAMSQVKIVFTNSSL